MDCRIFHPRDVDLDTRRLRLRGCTVTEVVNRRGGKAKGVNNE